MIEPRNNKDPEELNPEVEAEINQLRSMFEFRNDEKVTEFLRENTHLHDLLHETHDEIDESFEGKGSCG